MVLFHTKLTAAFGAAFAAFLSLGLAAPAEAAPPPGWRYSDIVGWTSPYHTGQGPGFRQSSRPAYTTPRYYSYAPVTQFPAVTSSAPAPATVSVRGPDGIVRTYPVEGPVVQQGAPAFVYIRDADGVLRTYPVVGSQPAGPVVTHPCR